MPAIARMPLLATMRSLEFTRYSPQWNDEAIVLGAGSQTVLVRERKVKVDFRQSFVQRTAGEWGRNHRQKKHQ